MGLSNRARNVTPHSHGFTWQLSVAPELDSFVKRVLTLDREAQSDTDKGGNLMREVKEVQRCRYLKN